jgi:hypothetical protein
MLGQTEKGVACETGYNLEMGTLHQTHHPSCSFAAGDTHPVLIGHLPPMVGSGQPVWALMWLVIQYFSFME